MMRFPYGGNAGVPCTPDCPERSAECHGACQAYRQYRARLDEQCAQRRQKAEIGGSVTRERAYRRNLKNQMQGRKIP